MPMTIRPRQVPMVLLQPPLKSLNFRHPRSFTESPSPPSLLPLPHSHSYIFSSPLHLSLFPLTISTYKRLKYNSTFWFWFHEKRRFKAWQINRIFHVFPFHSKVYCTLFLFIFLCSVKSPHLWCTFARNIRYVIRENSSFFDVPRAITNCIIYPATN